MARTPPLDLNRPGYFSSGRGLDFLEELKREAAAPTVSDASYGPRQLTSTSPASTTTGYPSQTGTNSQVSTGIQILADILNQPAIRGVMTGRGTEPTTEATESDQTKKPEAKGPQRQSFDDHAAFVLQEFIDKTNRGDFLQRPDISLYPGSAGKIAMLGEVAPWANEVEGSSDEPEGMPLDMWKSLTSDMRRNLAAGEPIEGIARRMGLDKETIEGWIKSPTPINANRVKAEAAATEDFSKADGTPFDSVLRRQTGVSGEDWAISKAKAELAREKKEAAVAPNIRGSAFDDTVRTYESGPVSKEYQDWLKRQQHADYLDAQDLHGGPTAYDTTAGPEAFAAAERTNQAVTNQAVIDEILMRAREKPIPTEFPPGTIQELKDTPREAGPYDDVNYGRQYVDPSEELERARRLLSGTTAFNAEFPMRDESGVVFKDDIRETFPRITEEALIDQLANKDAVEPYLTGGPVQAKGLVTQGEGVTTQATPETIEPEPGKMAAIMQMLSDPGAQRALGALLTTAVSGPRRGEALKAFSERMDVAAEHRLKQQKLDAEMAQNKEAARRWQISEDRLKESADALALDRDNTRIAANNKNIQDALQEIAGKGFLGRIENAIPRMEELYDVKLSDESKQSYINTERRAYNQETKYVHAYRGNVVTKAFYDALPDSEKFTAKGTPLYVGGNLRKAEAESLEKVIAAERAHKNDAQILADKGETVPSRFAILEAYPQFREMLIESGEINKYLLAGPRVFSATNPAITLLAKQMAIQGDIAGIPEVDMGPRYLRNKTVWSHLQTQLTKARKDFNDLKDMGGVERAMYPRRGGLTSQQTMKEDMTKLNDKIEMLMNKSDKAESKFAADEIASELIGQMLQHMKLTPDEPYIEGAEGKMLTIPEFFGDNYAKNVEYLKNLSLAKVGPTREGLKYRAFAKLFAEPRGVDALLDGAYRNISIRKEKAK